MAAGDEVQVLRPNPTSSVTTTTDDGRTTVIVEEKVNVFRAAIPILPMGLASVCCLLNIFIPGSGTLLATISLCICRLPTNRSTISYGHALCANLSAAIMQLLLAVVVVGWVWSVLWAILFIQLAARYQSKYTFK